MTRLKALVNYVAGNYFDTYTLNDQIDFDLIDSDDLFQISMLYMIQHEDLERFVAENSDKDIASSLLAILKWSSISDIEDTRVIELTLINDIIDFYKKTTLDLLQRELNNIREESVSEIKQDVNTGIYLD